ncbi:hypothetical protein Tco_0999361 [Tanacetum coccineum]
MANTRRYREYDLAHLKLIFGFSVYKVWSRCRYSISKVLDMAYWGFLGVGTTRVISFVKHHRKTTITPIEEIAATGWGDEFSDDEVTPGKVTILEERSDWDDDERNGGKVLVIQERLAQNQQEFLDEYLPQWDEHLAIQKQELESEWENPFAAKRGENHTILHLLKKKKKKMMICHTQSFETSNKWQHKSSSICFMPKAYF